MTDNQTTDQGNMAEHERRPTDTEVEEMRERIEDRLSGEAKASRAFSRPLGEKTPIQLGLVIMLLCMCAAGFGGWIWWASAVSAKLDMLLSQQTALVHITDSQGQKLSDLEAWRKLIDTVGSPQVQKMERDLENLKKDFEFHKAMEAQKTKP